MNVSAAVFQPKYNYVWKGVTISKNTSKNGRFQDVYDYHLILGEKQRLKQKKEMFFDTLATVTLFAQI